MAAEELQIVKPYHQTDRFSLYEGDCRSVFPIFADNSFDSIVTDPPAGISFMGKDWDHHKGGRDQWVAWLTEVMRECLRVLKPGGHALVWAIPRTSHWTGWAIESAGFEVRDRISHLFGSGFPKSLDISKAIDAAAGAEREDLGPNIRLGDQREYTKNPSSEFFHPNKAPTMGRVTAPTTDAAKQWSGWGTALKPACEDWWLARKPLDGTVAQNVLKHGTGGLNVDGCRIETTGDESLSGGNASTGGRRIASNDGWIRPWNTNEEYLAKRKAECEVRVAKAEDLGRWPANVIHDGSDEVLAGFPNTVEGGEGLAKRETRGYEGGWGDRAVFQYADSGSAARFFYCAKSSQDDRNEGLEDLPIKSAGEVTDRKDGSAGLNSPRAGAGRTNGSRNPHPTVKPTDLMRYLCRLVTPPSGLVLDPFCGSGSTGKAAMLEGLRFIGIELNADYCQLAQRRIEAVTKQGLLFA